VDFLLDIGGLIMTPLYYAISAILVAWHSVLTTLGMDEDGGGTWVLSIIGLTLVVRALAQVSGVSAETIAHRLMGQWEPSAEWYTQLIGNETTDADWSRS